jgi:hypothetical protein
MAGTAIWQITGTSEDGTQVIINVTATLNDDGSITVDYKLDDDSADADIIGVYFDFFNDGGDLDAAGTGRGSNANNMKGYGDGFDVAFEEGKAGLEDGANTEGSMTFSAEQLIAFGFGDFYDEDGELTDGAGLMKAFAETEIGIRATSTGDDGEGSLKIGAVGEYHPEEEPEEPTDHFPDLDSDISYVNFVFKLNDDASEDAKKAFEALDKNGDGYVTVKIEMPDLGELEDCLRDNVNNLDTWYQEALAAIYADPDFAILEDSAELIGVFIKGGQNLFSDPDLFDQDNVWSTGADDDIAFFLLDDDPGNDPLPDGLRTDSDGDIVATGPSGPTQDRYDDTGNDLDFDLNWVPEECLA